MIAVPLKRSDRELPPNDPNLEIQVLGCILFHCDSLNLIGESFNPSVFYNSAHQAIAAAMVTLFTNDKRIDVGSVARQLKADKKLDEIGGQSVLINLFDAAPVGTFRIDHDWSDLEDLATRRQLNHIGNEIVGSSRCLSIPVPNLVEQAEEQIFNLSRSQQSGYRLTHISEGCELVLNRLESNEDPGIKAGAGFLDLEELTTGWERKQVITVAAATAMGKTHFALAQAVAIASQGLPVVFFSCEMSVLELSCRLVARMAQVNSSRLRSNRLNSDEYGMVVTAMAKLTEIPLHLYEAPNPSPAEMRSKIREASLKSGKPVAMVVLDFLQLLDGGGPNRVTELDRLMRSNKAIATDFDLVFMQLAQINRGVENRSNKRPTLSDLRESGAIEQLSNVVLFLYREEYYDANTVDRGICEFIVCKNRGGNVGTTKVLFKPEFGLFRDIASSGR